MSKIARRFRKAFRSNAKGFTLIELLVVIGILAVIGGIVALNVGQFIGRGCTESARVELQNVRTAALAALADGQPASAYMDYLTGTLKGGYTVSTSGEVTQTDDGCD
ncbi:MAG: prepilin-type N-terminal cleavage/methylation domain-containing protein [Chloroflexi bacterium]|nr:prepilin-type N-terminal cleavage/methylation domain-containing protein [Chloroflexota bacterium]MBM3176084.1 prepilin-type N-terminal cleavage/methylation domain-containing protein [Chloroflexota bacterium]